MKDYIQKALRTESPITRELVERMTGSARVIHAIFGLFTEIGELVDIFKRHIFYGKPIDLTNMDEEIGDVLWYLAILMDFCGVDFQSCMRRNIQKLESRYPDKFNEEDALNRDLTAERSVLLGAGVLGHQEALFAAAKNLLEKYDDIDAIIDFDELREAVANLEIPNDDEEDDDDGDEEERTTADCKACGSRTTRPSPMNPGKFTCNNCGAIT